MRRKKHPKQLAPCTIEGSTRPAVESSVEHREDRIWENIQKGGLWLNEFHRQYSERLRENLKKQPKVSLAKALEQYEQIKRGSQRRKP